MKNAENVDQLLINGIDKQIRKRRKNKLPGLRLAANTPLVRMSFE
jgi:hypothetical protein